MQGGDHTWVWGSKVDIKYHSSITSHLYFHGTKFLPDIQVWQLECQWASGTCHPSCPLIPTPNKVGVTDAYWLPLLFTSIVGRMWGSEFRSSSPVSSTLQLSNTPSPTHPSVSALFSCCFNFVSHWVSSGRVLFAKVGVTYWNMDELIVATPLEKVYSPFQQWSLSVHGFSETPETPCWDISLILHKEP